MICIHSWQVKATLLKWTRGCADILLLESCPASSVAAYRFFASNKFTDINILCPDHFAMHIFKQANRFIFSRLMTQFEDDAAELMHVGHSKVLICPVKSALNRLHWFEHLWLNEQGFSLVLHLFTSFFSAVMTSLNMSQRDVKAQGMKIYKLKMARVPKKCKGGPWWSEGWGSRQDTETCHEHNKATFPKKNGEKWFRWRIWKHRCLCLEVRFRKI